MSKVIDVEQVLSWCSGQPSVTVDNTFGPQTDVYRVGNKIFAMVNVEHANMVTLKVLPEEGEALRAQHDFIRPGYYMNKRHWITVDLPAPASFEELSELIAESHRLVFHSLTKPARSRIQEDTA